MKVKEAAFSCQLTEWDAWAGSGGDEKEEKEGANDDSDFESLVWSSHIHLGSIKQDSYSVCWINSIHCPTIKVDNN